MTTLTIPSPPHPGAPMRPVPWRQLAWVAWRQYRAALAGAIVFFAVPSAYLLAMGLRIHTAYDASQHCGNGQTSACQAAGLQLDLQYHATADITAAVLTLLPVFIGAFAGAPILARELDSGTARFAWTQGAGRTRWTIARLALPALCLTVMAAAFSQLFQWFYQPFFSNGTDAPLEPQFFALTGVALAAWTLAAFAIGALAGVVIRNAVPAIIASLICSGGLLALTSFVLRRHYLAPLVDRVDGGQGVGAWVISQTTLFPSAGPAKVVTIFQPASRYWPFQLIEGGWLLALAVLLFAVTLWLVRRRAA